MKHLIAFMLAFVTVIAGHALWQLRPQSAPEWTAAETEVMESLSITTLPPPPADPSNAVADDEHAARFGHALFFDPRLSGNGGIACANCHQPIRRFTDGLPKGVALGMSKRNTPSIVGTAYSPWLYWDGRRDSQWSQALSPLEDPNEHGSDRMSVVRIVADDPAYRQAYEALFGPLPDLADPRRYPDAASPLGAAPLRDAWQRMAPADRDHVNRAFANVGKALAAYERRLVPGRSRFDEYVDAVLAGDSVRQRETFSVDEAIGLRLFLGEARCTECHNGPLLTNNEFHNTGVLSFPGDLPDVGRAAGLRLAEDDPFNCLGDYSDDPERYCAELEFARSGIELLGAVRTPSLRNLGDTGPFMHRGQLATLAEALEHYNEAPLAMIGHNESKPLGLSRRELDQLEAFLHTLDAAPATAPEWLAAPGASSLIAEGDQHETR